MSKIAEADIQETISDFFWDDADGPFENILRWANRFLIVFGGGPISILAMALTAAGMDFSELGRVIDEKFGLEELSDITQLNSDRAQEEISGLLMDQVQDAVGFTASGLTIPLSKTAQDPDETYVLPYRRQRQLEDLDDETYRSPDRRKERGDNARGRRSPGEETLVKRRLRRERELEERHLSLEERKRSRELAEKREQARQRERAEDIEREDQRERRKRQQRQEDIDRAEQRERHRKKEQKEDRRERQRERRRQERHQAKMQRAQAKTQARRMMGSGKLSKGALGLGIGGVIGWVIKSITDPKSLLSRALRGAGVIAAEEFSEGKEERRRAPGTPPLREPTTNLKTRLESKINEILQV